MRDTRAFIRQISRFRIRLIFFAGSRFLAVLPDGRPLFVTLDFLDLRQLCTVIVLSFKTCKLGFIPIFIVASERTYAVLTGVPAAVLKLSIVAACETQLFFSGSR